MTIHSSKGLEFPVVFLADLCKSFNRTDSRANVLTDPVLGLGSNCYDPAARILCPTIARQAIARRLDQEAVSEEMRVLYVAMTRPQYRLIMTCCAARLTRRLESYAQGLSLPPDAALLEGADSLGDWILLAAMTRPEAGELFAAAGSRTVRCRAATRGAFNSILLCRPPRRAGLPHRPPRRVSSRRSRASFHPMATQRR